MLREESPSSGFRTTPLGWRLAKDRLARLGVGLGGLGVILAIVLIFVYLLSVVLPLFQPARMAPLSSYALPAGEVGSVLGLALEEQLEIGLRYRGDGTVAFFRPADGSVIGVEQVVPMGMDVSAFAAGEPGSGIAAFGLADGRAVVFQVVFETRYPDGKRVITPRLEYPLGAAPVVVDPAGRPLRRLAVQGDEESTTVAGVVDDALVVGRFVLEESFLGEEPSVEAYHGNFPLQGRAVDHLLLDKEQRWLYAADGTGRLLVLELDEEAQVGLHEERTLLSDGATLTALGFLAGDISLLAGDSRGRIHQWFPVRDAQNRTRLTRVRTFALDGGRNRGAESDPVRLLVPEYHRRGFIAAGEGGRAVLFYATSQRTLASAQVGEHTLVQAALAPRANALLALDAGGRLHFWEIENEHPEISWSALWGKVWYESYLGPDYVWQSTSASNDFEPKFSLMPLTFGTLKAAFYAMLFAIPLGIMGAIYTAYFMAPRMRALVKPGIEIMEALPTVILGFLAGLWLAPLLEANLAGIFALLLLVPPGVLVFAWLWQRLPAHLRQRLPEGWDAALLVPVVLAVGALAWSGGPWLERLFFGGDLPGWLSHELGIDFDQRNALVVGIAMGFAVIPTIFSLAEDAIFSVPRHLRNGSLALGATQWQTLVRVVLLTASPGIFAAVMIGLGRAVGETMIVLMATGNTPVMDFSIFQGMRTLSANIAVEMPESEVGSTHYRILFLAALVLFLFTFLLNTLGEMVRQRLRRRYSNL